MTATTVLTLVPMSTVAARLWHQLQSEVIKETHGVATVPPGAIVLPALPTDHPARFRDEYSQTTMTLGNRDNTDRYIKRHSCPKSWSADMWHPAHWRHSLEREDAQGRSWSCAGGIYVTNDFGDLVQVAA